MTRIASRAFEPASEDAQLDAYHTTGTSPSRGASTRRRPPNRVRRGLAPLPQRFPLHHGSEICRGAVAYEAVGAPNAPVVLALGGISAGRHATSSALDPIPGWWEAFVGPGLALDTTLVRVIGIDYLGGPGASSRPPVDAAANQAVVDTRDQARAIGAVLDYLGTANVAAIVGSSYGGMVGLAFAELFPERLEHLLCISAAHRSHPMATALRSLQRRIVALGTDSGLEARSLSLARGLAMTTYRTAAEFDERFESAATNVDGRSHFQVEGYLDAQGARFAEAFDSVAFTTLSLSLDLHSVQPEAVRTPSTHVSVDSDTLVPPWLTQELAERIAGPADVVRIESLYGHDAFLKETDRVSAIVRGTVQTLGGGS